MKTRPPTFALVANTREVDDSYTRFLKNKLQVRLFFFFFSFFFLFFFFFFLNKGGLWGFTLQAGGYMKIGR